MSESVISDELIDEVEDTMTRLARLMSTRHMGPECCPESLSLSQMMLMRAIEASGALKVADVAAVLAVKPPAASAVIDGLERHGYAAREAASDDRRVTLVRLTDEGRSVLQEAETTRRQHMRRYLGLLSVEDVRAMIRIQQTLIHAIDNGLV